MRLKGKTALVTGAGQGFGFGIAEIFVREGARVAFLDLKADIAEAAARRFGDAGAIALHADVRTGKTSSARPKRRSRPLGASTSWSTTPAPPTATSR